MSKLASSSCIYCLWEFTRLAKPFRKHQQGTFDFACRCSYKDLPSFLWAQTLTWSKNLLEGPITHNQRPFPQTLVYLNVIANPRRRSWIWHSSIANRKIKKPKHWSKDTALIKSRIRTQSKKAFSIDYLNATMMPQFSYNLHVLLRTRMRRLPILSLSADMYASVFGYHKWHCILIRIPALFQLQMQALAKRLTTGSFNIAPKLGLH